MDDYLDRHPLFSMAVDRDAYSLKLTNKFSFNLVSHLLRLYYFPDHPAYNHWRNESFGFLPHELDVFTGSHKFPDFKFIYYALFVKINKDSSFFKRFRGVLLKKKLPLPSNLEDLFPGFMNKVGLVIRDICKILARDSLIFKDEYFAVLDKHDL